MYSRCSGNNGLGGSNIIATNLWTLFTQKRGCTDLIHRRRPYKADQVSTMIRPIHIEYSYF